MKLVGLIEMCLSTTYSAVRVGKHLSDTFLNKNGLKKEVLCRHCLSTLLYNMPLGGLKETKRA
jgi:hypothetical protein